MDPDAGSFSSQAVHPTFMFQGEYDLVYRWRGTAEIIDLKASVGASDRTAGYHAQLRAYAALWRATHEGAPLPLGSRFGSSAPEMPWMLVPDDAWCDAFEARVASLWEELRQEDPDEASCPPHPRRIRTTAAGAFLRALTRTTEALPWLRVAGHLPRTRR